MSPLRHGETMCVGYSGRAANGAVRFTTKNIVTRSCGNIQSLVRYVSVYLRKKESQ